MSEQVVKITLSETDLDHIIWGLTAISTIRLPLDPKWRKPYEAKLKELQKIQEEMIEVKRDREMIDASKKALGDSFCDDCD
ncbi:MAG: hypothetical protein Unbinned400contig1004_34 [Prokaryotic dsDNA virus sp.]|nr:MAG: hypothetical protein Unbinned400contig1004_34 [Prokaryotic dsDNA virus sp.]|tara:strand:+ start:1545 stop:1787 length:243 start_codon:yes stop_codon:yes gene_type:complete